MIVLPVRKKSILIFVLLSIFQLTATGVSAAVPAGRIQHLRHGLNMPGWLAQVTVPFTKEYVESWITDAEIERIRATGFDHVRLCVDPELFGEGLEPELPDFRLVDQAVNRLLEHGLAVVLDIHPNIEFEHDLLTDPKARQKFILFLRDFGRHFARLDSERVYFQILNEPELSLTETSQVALDRYLQNLNSFDSALRKEAPRQTFIVAGFSSPKDLVGMRPLKDTNVIYDFHFYLPGIFTHQGTTWAVPYYSKLKGVPYPLGPGDSGKILAQLTDEADRRRYMGTYGSLSWPNSIRSRGWNSSRIEQAILHVVSWAKKSHVSLICEEFGAFPKYSAPAARAAWISDVRTSLERHGIGWAIWDYNGAFAIFSGVHGRLEADPLIVRALGL